VKSTYPLFFTFIVFVVSTIDCALACEGKYGIRDYNCDKLVQVTVIGDSLVYGFGDTVKGGYVARLRNKLPEITISGIGIRGLITPGLVSFLNKNLKPEARSNSKNILMRSDIIIIDAGRNDRWSFGPAKDAFNNLKKAASIIRKEVKAQTGLEPYVVIAVMMYPNRGAQGPWMKDLNSFISKSDSINTPANVRFDTVSKRLLGPDRLHPTPQGYSRLSSVLESYLRNSTLSRMRQLRPDTDQDGIPDEVESVKFLTDPNLSDTDGDGVNDYEELFVRDSDPLNP